MEIFVTNKYVQYFIGDIDGDNGMAFLMWVVSGEYISSFYWNLFFVLPAEVILFSFSCDAPFIVLFPTELRKEQMMKCLITIAD